MFVLVLLQAWQFLCERIKIRDCTAFLSKVTRKFVNNQVQIDMEAIVSFCFILSWH